MLTKEAIIWALCGPHFQHVPKKVKLSPVFHVQRCTTSFWWMMMFMFWWPDARSEPITSRVHFMHHHPAISPPDAISCSTLCISKEVVRMWITAAPLPLLSSPPGTTFRGALRLYSPGVTDGLCIIQHDNCIKHEHSSAVSADHTSLWFMGGRSLVQEAILTQMF